MLLLSSCISEVAKSPSCLYLDNTQENDSSVPLLQREIIRQALAMVCRDDFGLVCRDVTLGDPLPEQGALRLDPFVGQNTNGLFVILHRVNNTNEIWRASFDNSGYAELLASVEKEAAGRLKNQIQSIQSPHIPPRPADNGMDIARVDSSSLPDLFDLLRSAHAAHTGGATPITYEVLIRGYANLGTLTSYTWNGAYKVYQARSLLYAQQFVRTHPKSGLAYYLRAYAFGLCGLHTPALADLAAGKALANNPVPEWIPLLDGFLHFRTEALVQAANKEGACRYTASVLALKTLEYTPFQSRVSSTYKAIEKKSAVDFRTLDQLNEAGGVSSLHKTTILGFIQMCYLLQRQLPEHTLFPESVSSLLHTATDEELAQEVLSGARTGEWPVLTEIPNLYRALNQETATGLDQGDPSLAAFGDLLRENMFIIAAWRQHFMNNKWSVDIDTFTREMLSCVAGHRYQNVLAAYAAKRHQSPEEYLSLLKMVRPTDLPAGAHLFLTAFYDENAVYGSEKGSELRSRYLAGLDQTHRDQLRAADLTKDKQKLTGLAEQVLKISPYSPYGRRIKLTHQSDWETLYKQYEEDGPLYPELSQIVAWQYVIAKKYAQAIHYYEQAVSQLEESYVYRALADCYLKTGNEKRWLETMESTLHLPDYGLEHANTQVTIAKKFMTDGDIPRARIYAEAAAECYSQWALSLAGECAMAAGDLPRAQELLKNEAERYGRKDAVPWKLYYKAQIYQIPETEAWFRAVSARIETSLNNARHELLEDVFCGFYHWRAKQFDAAATCFHDAFLKKSDVWYSLLEALVRLEQGDQQKYVQVLNDIINNFKSTKDTSSSRQQIRKLAVLMREYAEGQRSAETLYADLSAMKKDGALYPADYFFFTGKYLALVGQEKEAIQFFYKGIEPEQIDRWAGPFPFLELKDRGLDPFSRYTKKIPEYQKPM